MRLSEVVIQQCCEFASCSHVVIDWYKCKGRAAGTHLKVVKTSRCKLLTCHRLSSASASVCIFV